MKKEILEFLKEKPEMSLEELYNKSGVDVKDKLATAKIRGSLNAMVKKNDIKRVKKGTYSL